MLFNCSQQNYYPISPPYLMSQHSIKFFFCNRKSLSINAVNNQNDELGKNTNSIVCKYKLQITESTISKDHYHQFSYRRQTLSEDTRKEKVTKERKESSKKGEFEITAIILQHILQITLPYKIKGIHQPLKMTTKYENLTQFNAAVTLRCLADEVEQ